MRMQKLPDSDQVTQIFPEKKQLPLAGLYLRQGLAAISENMGRCLVITNFLMDQKGVIAKTDQVQHLQVPVEIKNASDWRLFQELLAQADVMITSSSYLRRASAANSQAQNVLSQFEPGGEFEQFGEWRLANGYPKRSPDLAVITRSLDFQIPNDGLRSDQRKIIFTTHGMAASAEARVLIDSGAQVIGCGETGVDGNQMIDWLNNAMGYRVVMSSAGPGALQILLAAQRLDYFYVTEAQREIPLDPPSTGQALLPGGKKVRELNEFVLAYQMIQDHVTTEDGSRISQVFSRYDRKGILSE